MEIIAFLGYNFSVKIELVRIDACGAPNKYIRNSFHS